MWAPPRQRASVTLPDRVLIAMRNLGTEITLATTLIAKVGVLRSLLVEALGGVWGVVLEEVIDDCNSMNPEGIPSGLRGVGFCLQNYRGT